MRPDFLFGDNPPETREIDRDRFDRGRGQLTTVHFTLVLTERRLKRGFPCCASKNLFQSAPR